ncbi:MAG: glutamine-hydrolyzing GMP synthase [Bacteroidales bacterium]|nr:glutamine-hydrolyzing GMP synthase [Bacteroidales bacterium]MCF8386975.1 glutamine-hydrolyzing GMP synthase [Bacteroidales bacterium]MCF8397014.1 glutamine-hydrolyzing GMP synthase [Bacteroidales bacterium]
MEETIIILDFGSQYTQLIARRVRELNVYCEIHPFNKIPEKKENIKGVILSGSPFSVYDKGAPRPNLKELKKNYPVLGVCYGAQLLALEDGAEMIHSTIREYGRANIGYVNYENPLMKGVSSGSQVWMSHGDTITHLPKTYEPIASTEDVQVAGFWMKDHNIFGLQFHPEVYHSVEGKLILENYLVNVCKCSQSWTPISFIEDSVNGLVKQLGNDKVVLGLSGGVDSSVAAMLLHRAIGKNLHCIFVDNGLLRKNEFETVLQQYEGLGLNVKGVDAKERFLGNLKEATDPEKKRKIIGSTFIDVFDEEAHKIKDVKWLAQGTIYPDVIESVSVNGPSVTIKSHHNVGGLPAKMKMKVVEPLRTLFKDEVRVIGSALKMPKDILSRHPFPGPGLGIRILGDITAEKVRILQEVDQLYIEGLKKNDLYDKVWQAGAILLPIQSVGVMGDERTYENVVALRAVGSTDGMTADWSHLPYEFLAKISSDIINKVKGVNRVVYDISSKPPSTIEWE